jgi:rRNA maturation endonuclease Nob1
MTIKYYMKITQCENCNCIQVESKFCIDCGSAKIKIVDDKLPF